MDLRVRAWGGARPGSGPKKKPGSGVPHRRRARVSRHEPLHVTLRLVRGLPTLRRKKTFRVVRRALAAGAERFGFRLVHYSVMSNHLHLFVEANDRRALSRGMKGLQVRVARRLNRHLGRSGRVFADRFHARALKTPTEVRNALAYVLLNARKHAARAGWELPPVIDEYSSGRTFDGWRHLRGPPASRFTLGTTAPRSWLARVGWRRRGLLRLTEVPG